MKPMPMRLGGVPTGVASPPMDAANEVISISPVAYRGSMAASVPGALSAARMESAMPNIMAVVAVLEIHAEIRAVATPKARRIRVGRAPTQGSESTAYATRRSRPWRKIPRARMNAPMKRNISGSANGAKTTFAGATPSTTHAAAPSRAVTGSGSASVTHSTTTAASTAPRRWASGESPVMGQASSETNTAGASTDPMRPRTLRRIRHGSVSTIHAGWSHGADFEFMAVSRPGPRACSATCLRALEYDRP